MRLLAALTLAGMTATSSAFAADLAVGQTFACHPDGQIIAVVGRLDPAGDKVIASVSLFDQAPGSRAADVGHIPIDAGALKAACPSPAPKRALSENFEGGYALWREAFDAGKAGAFDIPVDQIIEVILSQMPREAPAGSAT